MTVTEYIKENWPLCVRENKEDDGTLLGMPFPYTVPCVEGHFQEMYYWDTYFINHGLILLGNVEQALNNVENMFNLIERYGFMPNANRTYSTRNSQPPFLSEMVMDVYKSTQDKKWLKRAVNYLIKEYTFWESERNTPIGLAQYKGNIDAAINGKLYNDFFRRIKKSPEGYSEDHFSVQCIIAWESGWDISPRFGFDAQDYVQVELNSLLCAMERNISFFLEELNDDSSKKWKAKAEERYEKMNRFMLSDGVFYDYDLKKNQTSGIFSCASLYPMWLGLLTEEQAKATVEQLYRIDAPYGLYATENIDSDYNMQWGYPNGWAPLHQIAIAGLLRYGYIDKAKLIAEKYVSLVEKNFEQTGKLWEKYNVKEGNINVVTEGVKAMPSMMGWSAGVYLYAKDILII